MGIGRAASRWPRIRCSISDKVVGTSLNLLVRHAVPFRVFDPAVEVLQAVAHRLSEGQGDYLPFVRARHSAGAHRILALKLQSSVAVVFVGWSAGIGLLHSRSRKNWPGSPQRRGFYWLMRQSMATAIKRPRSTSKTRSQKISGRSPCDASREPLGGLRSRRIDSATYATTLPGAPDGEYVVILYESSFENKRSAVETVTVTLDSDGTWRVSGYFVR